MIAHRLNARLERRPSNGELQQRGVIPSSAGAPQLAASALALERRPAGAKRWPRLHLHRRCCNSSPPSRTSSHPGQLVADSLNSSLARRPSLSEVQQAGIIKGAPGVAPHLIEASQALQRRRLSADLDASLAMRPGTPLPPPPPWSSPLPRRLQYAEAVAPKVPSMLSPLAMASSKAKLEASCSALGPRPPPPPSLASLPSPLHPHRHRHRHRHPPPSPLASESRAESLCLPRLARPRPGNARAQARAHARGINPAPPTPGEHLLHLGHMGRVQPAQ